jgi:nitrogen-specific signal transduction histidine kinase
MEFALLPLSHSLIFGVRQIDMDSSVDSARAVAAIARIDAVPTLLKVLCEVTGMRIAVVARVIGKNWTACAVKDEVDFGLKPGMELQVDTTFCFDARISRLPIVIEHASADPRCHQAAPKRYHVESYVSVPIIRADGDCFGSLCVLDPKPTKVAPLTLSVCNDFAALIALKLDHQAQQEQEHRALLDERAAGELREQFIAILGHDLRNPLQAVFASGEMLERRFTDPAILTMASRIKANVRRMSSLIDDVLDFARGRLGGGIEVEITEIDNINMGLEAVVQELRDAQPDGQIISDIRITRPVRCDLGRIQQIASNLLGNALTHGQPDSPIKISARADENDLVLEVWNEGEPIPAESLSKIFEPFWRHSVSRSRNGLGLGLHICSQIVRAHQGRISVTSTREHGTQFTARLPLGTAQTTQVLPRTLYDGNRPRTH